MRALAPRARLVHSIADVASSADVELCIIATPDATHYEYGMALLRAGKHVLIDKPMAETVEQALHLLSTAVTAQRVCMPYQNRRYDGDFRTVVQLLQTGALGSLVEYEAHFDRFRPVVADSWKEKDRGALANLGPHLIDQAVCLFGEPDAVWADVAVLRAGGDTDDYFEVHMFFNDSTAASPRLKGLVHPAPRKAIVKSNILAADNDLRYVLHGSGGSFIKRGIDGQEAALRAGGVVLPQGDGWGEERPQWHGTLTRADGGKEVVRTLPGQYAQLYANLEQVMAGADAAGVQPSEMQEVTPRQVMAVMRIMHLARRSAAEGRRVPYADAAAEAM